MQTVISHTNKSTHVISKYNFKVLPISVNNESAVSKSDDGFVSGLSSRSSSDTASENIEESSSVETPNSLSKSSKDALIESLLEKTDAMSSNFIKMQMKLESKDEEYKLALVEAKKEAFEEGRVAGVKEAEEMVQTEHASLMKQFSSSVETLDKSTQEFSASIEGIKEELIHAAIDIAKEVILVEVSANGKQIASTLAQNLITEIQTSSQVTIKVNPNDKVAIEQSLGTLENVKIISDNAVHNGGVVILSDAGNIDGDIMKRYARVKNVALGNN